MNNLLIAAYNELQMVYVNGSDNVFHMANALKAIQTLIEQGEKEDEQGNDN